MCGILVCAGLGRPFSHRNLDSLRRRGPDAVGFWSDERVHLAQTRLAIIGLDDRGTEPRREPTLVTTNRGLPGWGEVFGDAVVAGAILDRLMHRAVVFNIRGPSWRMREHAALAEATRT